VPTAAWQPQCQRPERSPADRRAELDAAFATNVKGYAFGVKHAARAMQRNPGDARKLTAGAIVNVASTSGFVAQPGFVPYSMTKAAVMQLSRCAALDLGKHGIRCSRSPAAGCCAGCCDPFSIYSKSHGLRGVDLHYCSDGHASSAFVFVVSAIAQQVTSTRASGWGRQPAVA